LIRYTVCRLSFAALAIELDRWAPRWATNSCQHPLIARYLDWPTGQRQGTGGSPIQPAPGKAAAILSVLEHSGIEVADPDIGVVAVEGLVLHLSTDFWRSDDGKQGYNVHTFLAEYRRRRGSSALLPKLSM
jgi:hypothetical protein